MSKVKYALGVIAALVIGSLPLTGPVGLVLLGFVIAAWLNSRERSKETHEKWELERLRKEQEK